MPYKGTAAELRDIIQPIAAQRGKLLCAYPCEVAKVQEAVTIVDAIQKEDALLTCLHAADQSLTFGKVVIECALKLLLAQHQKKWNLQPEDHADWVQTITRRIRNLLRIVTQPMVKGKAPPWLKKLAFYKKALAAIAEVEDIVSDKEDDDAGEAGDAEEADEDDEDDNAPLVPPVPKYTLKFDKELMLCTRSAVGIPRELSFAIIDLPSRDEADMVKASFANGDIVEVPGLTYLALRRLQRKTHTGTGKLWVGEHSVTHHSLCIEQRVDRKLLLSIFEQSKQRLQVRVDQFGIVLDHTKPLHHDDPVLQLALKFLQPIAEKFALDQLKVTDLSNYRNEAFDRAGIGAKAKAAPNKRPAGPVSISSAAPSTAKKLRPAAAPAAASIAAEPDQVMPYEEMEPPPESTLDVMNRFLNFNR
jgi:hypothetical protein